MIHSSHTTTEAWRGTGRHAKIKPSSEQLRNERRLWKMLAEISLRAVLHGGRGKEGSNRWKLIPDVTLRNSPPFWWVRDCCGSNAAAKPSVGSGSHGIISALGQAHPIRTHMVGSHRNDCGICRLIFELDRHRPDNVKRDTCGKHNAF